MIVLFLLTIAGILYLANRIGKFTFIKKLTKGKKRFQTPTGLLIAATITAIIWIAWGSMNAIICILHLIVFWMVSDLIFYLIKKLGKKSFTRYYAGAAAILFTIGYLGIGWYLAHHVWETDYQIQNYRGYDWDDLIQELEKNKVYVLQDNVELIDNRFYIIGRQDKSEEYASGRKKMKELTDGLYPDKFSIVLDHQPQDYSAQAAADVDLVSGISDWAIKFKTGCKSQYLLIEIQGADV